MTCFTRRFVICAAALGLLAGQAMAESILVSSKNSNQILQYNAETGVFEGVFADAATLGTDPVGGNLLVEPVGMGVGPDGNVYVGYRDDLGNAESGGVLRFQPDGTFIDVYSTAVPNIGDLTFDAAGNLLVTKTGSCVYRILGPSDANAGELDPAFTPYPAANIKSVEPVPEEYTTSGLPEFFRAITAVGGQVRRATGDTGDTGSYSLEIYTGFETDSLGMPYGLEFGPDGKLYAVTNAGPPNNYSTSLWALDLPGGATVFEKVIDFLDADPSINMPLGMCFTDDTTLLVTNYDNAIAKFDISTNTYLGELVSNGDGGLDGPHYGLIVLPEGGGPGELEGDLNGDGMVGSADLDIVRGNWGQNRLRSRTRRSLRRRNRRLGRPRHRPRQLGPNGRRVRSGTEHSRVPLRWNRIDFRDPSSLRVPCKTAIVAFRPGRNRPQLPFSTDLSSAVS